MGYYQFTPRRLVFGNYFPRTQLLEPAAMLPKLSAIDHKIHLVYQGRLAEKKSDHRYIVNQLAGFPADRYVIHIFPSNSKEFAEYRALPQVVLERKLPYAELIKAISAMDYGLVMFQDTIAAKLPAIRYAFGNKTYDYLCAGLPIMVQDCLDEVRDFVQEQQVGVVVPRDGSQELPDEQGYNKLVNRVLEVREQFSMEAQVERLLEFYQTCRSACHA